MGEGLGIGGSPRRGNPKTDEERAQEHQRRFGNNDTPERGAGLRKRLAKEQGFKYGPDDEEEEEEED
jgi:hypothetical protein